MDYFEGVRLFDKPLFDLNAVRHFLHNMQDRYDQGFKRLWPEKKYNLFERFVISHKGCGTYIKLIIIDTAMENPQQQNEPERKLVKATSESEQKEFPKLRVIRGRR